MGSHLEVLWAHFSVHTSNFNWFLKIFSLMKSGSTLLGWDDSSVIRSLRYYRYMWTVDYGTGTSLITRSNFSFPGLLGSSLFLDV